MEFKHLREKVEGIGKETTPPAVLLLKRRGVRVFPNGQKVALFTNDQYNLTFSVPYGMVGNEQDPITAVKEETVNEFHNALSGVGSALVGYLKGKPVSSNMKRAARQRMAKKKKPKP